MHILVTGGAGFIGSNFVRELIDDGGYRITTLDVLTYAGNRQNLDGILDHPDHEFVEGDIRDEQLIRNLLSTADAVVNFAAESHVDRSIDDTEPFVSTNIDGTRTLLDAAVDEDLAQFVQVSTDEVYGEVIDGEFSEEDPMAPRNPYAATKAGADHLALSYHTTYNLPVVVTRSSNNFGPRQHPEKLIPKFITRGVNGKSLPLYGDGSHVREWTYVTDNCRAIEMILSEGAPGEVYNVGSGVELQNREVAKKIADTIGCSREQIEFVEDRPGHDRRYALDTSKIENLGWEPEWSFEEGLQQTVEYYLS